MCLSSVSFLVTEAVHKGQLFPHLHHTHASGAWRGVKEEERAHEKQCKLACIWDAVTTHLTIIRFIQVPSVSPTLLGSDTQF